MKNQSLGWFKFWKNFRASELYKKPSVNLVYTEMCLMHNENKLPVNARALANALQLSLPTTYKVLNLLLQAGFVSANQNQFPKRYDLILPEEDGRPVQAFLLNHHASGGGRRPAWTPPPFIFNEQSHRDKKFTL